MIACDRCRKRVESAHNLRGTYRYINDIEAFSEDYSLCITCRDSWDAMRKALETHIYAHVKQEGALRLAEWMGSADVMYDPWSKATERVEESAK